MTDTNTAPVPAAATDTPAAEVAGLPGLEGVCRARGWSLSRAAMEIGEYPAAIYSWARGRTSPGAPVIVRLAKKLGCSADALLGLPEAADLLVVVDDPGDRSRLGFTVQPGPGSGDRAVVSVRPDFYVVAEGGTLRVLGADGVTPREVRAGPPTREV